MNLGFDVGPLKGNDSVLEAFCRVGISPTGLPRVVEKKTTLRDKKFNMDRPWRTAVCRLVRSMRENGTLSARAQVQIVCSGKMGPSRA